MESPAQDERRAERPQCDEEVLWDSQPLLSPSISVFHISLLRCCCGHEAAPPLACVVGIVVSSRGINVTFCHAVSVTVPCGFLSTYICPQKHEYVLHFPNTLQLLFSAMCCLLQHLHQLYSTSHWVFTASRALCSSVSPFLITASLDSPHQVPVVEMGVAVTAQLLTDYFCVK